MSSTYLMELTNSTFAPLRVLVDELARCGVTDAVLCPGSRDVPLIYCFADQPQITVHSMLDERSAGFFALGIAKQSGRPVALVCTSGTAAANLLPAVVEASEANIGLIVLTADRPPELRDVGAGQVIDQIKIFGAYTRWFNEVGTMDLNEEALRHHRGLACRAFAEANTIRPGPVHLNISLRDPLFPKQSDLTQLQLTDGGLGRADGVPWLATIDTALAGSSDLARRLAAAARPLLVVGELHSERQREAIAAVSARLSIPVFADALSGLRAARYSQTACIMAAYETALREPTVASQIDPDLIVRIGPLATSKPLRQWLASCGAEQILLGEHVVARDPAQSAASVVRADLAATLALVGDDTTPSHSPWRERLSRIEETAQAAITSALSGVEFPSEPAIARELASAVPDGTIVWLSSSMPVRDIECFAPTGTTNVRYLSNRGANGIDGVLSSALGATVASGKPAVLLIGDLALLHDVGALAVMQREQIALTIVCVDNDGGGIFEFLPISEYDTHFERLIATPHGSDIGAIARGFGIAYSEPENADQLAAALQRPGLVHLKTERAKNRELHAEIWRHTSNTLLELASVGLLAE